MQCSRCQHENPPAQKFCGECGTPLPRACSACGSTNLPGQKFCGECGAPLTPGSAGPVTPAGPPAEEPAPGLARPGAPPVAAGARFASPAAYTPHHLAEKILTSRTTVEGERKQVTVVFTDVSGFTAMAEALDPEDVHAIMDRAFEVMLAAVHETEGTVNQFLGDGIMALFGAPIAHEDHAHRALRAALAIQARLVPLGQEVRRAYGRDFRIRVGINTGLVVVGAIGRDLRMDYTAVGDTTNLASRLLNVARPGQIVVSPTTHRACHGFFVFDDLGDFQVKGKHEPVRAYAVREEMQGRTRLEVSRDRGLTPLVGRGGERERLAAAFADARAGRGRVVLVSGEAGVGKSRLLFEFLKSLSGESLEIEATCVSYGNAMPYRPIIDLTRRCLAVREGASRDEVQTRVSQGLAAVGIDEDEARTLLAHFLGVPAPPEFLGRLHEAALRDRTMRVLRSLLCRSSAHRPLVVVVENLHWIDASSEAFLALLGEAVPQHAVLLLLTTRAGAPVAWLPKEAETIALEGLSLDELRAMVLAMLGARTISEALFGLLVTRGEGNPLYVEEIVRQLQETGGIRVEDGHADMTARDVTVPETIHDIIAARVDRLTDELKQTLQVGAVIGRRFGASLVSHVLAAEPRAVETRLRVLHRMDFVFPSARHPEPMHSFKHAMTQDVVYGNLLERRRRRYHAAAGEGLERLYADSLDEVVELLAHHFGRSAEDEKAVDYAIRAAEKAQRRWANAEALALFESALARLDAMPETDANRQRRIDAVVKQAEVMFALGRHAEHVSALERIRELVDATADAPRRAAWYYWAGFLHSLVGSPPGVAIEYCERARAIAEEGGFAEIRAYAECCLAHVLMAAGDLRGALRAGERALATFEARGNVWWACRTLWALSPVANGLGAWEQALEYAGRALAHGEALDDLRMKVVGLWRTGSTHIQRGDVAAGLERCEQALALSPTPFDAAMIRAMRAHGLVKVGDAAAGVAGLEEAGGWFSRSQLHYTRSVVALWTAEAHLALDRVEVAQAVLDEVLRTSREKGYRHLEGVAERLLGEALPPREPAACARLEAAVTILGEVGARNEMARALVGQAACHRARGDVARARACLERARTVFEALGTLDGPPLVEAALDVLDACSGAGPSDTLLVVVSRRRPLLARALARLVRGDARVRVAVEGADGIPGWEPGTAPESDADRPGYVLVRGEAA
jgi:class 3 adenylate cyclase/tetratricopeptide (TPR) repeat protein